MPLLSVIVPIYLKEQYLSNCINSILNQSIKDLEIILVDDGSPDASGSICDRYALKDKRIRVIHQKNAGPNAARNRGLQIASGDYIAFVDPDDKIDYDMYEKMIHTSISQNADLVICGLKYSSNNELRFIQCDQSYWNTVIDSSQLLQLAFSANQKVFFGSLNNKLFKRHLLLNTSLTENICLFEDWLSLLNIYNFVNTCYIDPTPYYFYRTDSENSLGKTTNLSIINSSLSVFFKVIKKYDKQPELYAAAIERYLRDSVAFINQGRTNSISSHVYKLCIKLKMLRILLPASVKQLLSKQRIHMFLIEGILRS